MNIYVKEMKANLRSLLFWSLGILIMIAGGMGKYAASVASGQSFDAVLEQLPPALQAMMGVGLLDYSKASSFYTILFLYLLLMATIHASTLGALIIAKEERDRTSEFLFVKPVTRGNVVTAKLLAALTNVMLLNLVTWAASAGIVGYYSGGEDLSGGIASLMLGLFLVQLLFLSVGAAAAAAIKRHKASSGVATGVLMATFLLYVAIDIDGNIDWLRPLTPFLYFDAKQIMFGRGFEWGHAALAAAVTAVLTAATYFFFRRRDLKV